MNTRVLSLISLVLLAGCGTLQQGNALDQQSSIGPSAPASTALLVVRLSNKVKVNHQPLIERITFLAPGDSEILGGHSMTPQSPNLHVPMSHNEYLLSVNLPPGEYRLIMGCYSGSGRYKDSDPSFPVRPEYTVKIEPQEVVYLGRLEVEIVPWSRGSPRSSPIPIPVLSESPAGFYEGMLRINVVDGRPSDLNNFTSAYPALRGVSVATRLIDTTSGLPSGRRTSESANPSIYEPAWQPAELVPTPPLPDKDNGS